LPVPLCHLAQAVYSKAVQSEMGYLPVLMAAVQTGFLKLYLGTLPNLKAK
jgi:hypothetical protein